MAGITCWSSGRYGALTPVYHQFYRIYDFGRNEKLPIEPETIIVEDSNSGFEFFQDATARAKIACVSAKRKSNKEKILDSMEGISFRRKDD